jgi:hypothetical protein
MQSEKRGDIKKADKHKIQGKVFNCIESQYGISNVSYAF